MDVLAEIERAENEPQRALANKTNASLILCGGVYFLLDEDLLLYIGETGCFSSRIANHLADKRIPFNRVEVIIEQDVIKRVRLEQALIYKFNPSYNSRGVRHGTVRNIGNQFRAADYQSSFDKSNMIDPEFDD